MNVRGVSWYQERLFRVLGNSTISLTHTNCVSLDPAFNGGRWSRCERLILDHAGERYTQPLLTQPGVRGRLYLPTEPALHLSVRQQNQPETNLGSAIETLPYRNNPDLH